ncbi:Mismatch repair protein msh3 [Coemansia sp. RSA 552]|nr:Mismatch repair protein msh3 [Coemansia sp. RSA 552]
MGTPKRVQASLSSFFKPKATAADTGEKRSGAEEGAGQGRARGEGQPPAAKAHGGIAKRRRLDSESGDNGLRRHEARAEPVPSTGQQEGSESVGRTLVRRVADATKLMDRLRVRAQENDGVRMAMAGVANDTDVVQLVRRQAGVKYTPLEQQVLDAKKKHADMILAVEVGYKYRFFGEDARIAARVLGIMCTTANNFYNASIPTPRLMVHVRRLVAAGYKVGMLRQTETAALKAAGDNRSAPFTRRLAEVFTTGTLVEEGDGDEHYLLSLVERPAGQHVSFGMLAVKPTTGDVVYDFFDDGYLRSGLETRLAHLRPGELLLPPDLSPESLRVLSAYAGVSIDYSAPREPLLEHANWAGVRVAFARAELLDDVAARRFVTDFYTENDASALLSAALDLPDPTIAALATAADYLKPFRLEPALLSGKGDAAVLPFAPFHTRTHMLLSATALQTLSVFSSSKDQGEESAVLLKKLLKPDSRASGMQSTYIRDGDGSLFSVMDCTRSQFGRRMLRRWIAHPLVSRDALLERTEAVEYLKRVMEDVDAGDFDGPVGSCKKALAAIHAKIGQLVDLERGLCRIQYAQANPQEVLRVLGSLETAAKLVPPELDAAGPRLLAEVLTADTWTAELHDTIRGWKSQLDFSSAKSGRKDTLFAHGPLRDQVQRHHDAIAAVESELDAYAGTVREVLDDSSFQFRSISGIDYLIDVKNARAKSVPVDWVKISGTKTNSRFHTPFIAEKLTERERAREELQNAASNAYRLFLAGISEKYPQLRKMVTALATLDALFSLAVLAQRDGYCRPELVEDTGEAMVDLVDAVNPVLAPTMSAYVPNSVQLGGNEDPSRTMILTGPNAGGKSSLIRTVALISIMAQCGSYVPAARARLSMVDAIYTRMGASDNMLAGESTFMVEMRETADLIRQVTPRSLAIVDELGRGTSTHDGAAIAYAVLDHLAHCRPLTFFVTHYAHLVDAFASSPLVRSCHMSFLERPPTAADADAGIADIAFLYKLVGGASSDSFGLNVARLAGLPGSLLLRAKERAAWMRDELDSKWAVKCARQLRRAIAQATATAAAGTACSH